MEMKNDFFNFPANGRQLFSTTFEKDVFVQIGWT